MTTTRNRSAPGDAHACRGRPRRHVGGCGSSNELSRSELIAKADAICKRVNTAVAEAKLAPQNITQTAPGISTAELQASTELAKLNPPSSMAGNWKVIVAGFHETGLGMQKAAEAAKDSGAKSASPQSKALREAEVVVFKGQQTRQRAAAQDGFIDCGRF